MTVDDNKVKCPKCNSDDVVKFGKRKDKAGLFQKHLCNDCCHVFKGDKLDD